MTLTRSHALVIAAPVLVLAVSFVATRSSGGPSSSDALLALRALQASTSPVASAVEGVEEIDGVDLLARQARQAFVDDGLGELASAEPFDCLASGENAWTCDVWLTDKNGRQAAQRWLFVHPSRGWVAQRPYQKTGAQP